jgi:hypothetical protein
MKMGETFLRNVRFCANYTALQSTRQNLMLANVSFKCDCFLRVIPSVKGKVAPVLN